MPRRRHRKDEVVAMGLGELEASPDKRRGISDFTHCHCLARYLTSTASSTLTLAFATACCIQLILVNIFFIRS